MVNKNRLLEKINKQESFLSPTGYRIGFFFRNDNYLTYREDGLEILTDPKRKSIVPYLYYNDIRDVVASRIIHMFDLIMAIICFVLVIPSAGATGLLGLAFLWYGFCWKIKIISNGGKEIILYTRKTSLKNGIIELL